MKAASFLTVLVIGFFSVAWGQQDGDERAEAIRAIEKIGGRIGYDEDAPGKPVVVVDFVYSKTVKDEDVVNLKAFRMLTTLTFVGNDITGKGLLKLDGFDHLEGLDLMDTKIDYDALKWVAKNKGLR